MKDILAGIKYEIAMTLSLKPLTDEQVKVLEELKAAIEKVERLIYDGE